MGTMYQDTVDQDTTVRSTMGEGLIEAKLISREYCLSHWVITLSQSGQCINADLSKNVIRYSRSPLPEVISSIGFRIKDAQPPIDDLMKNLWVPFVKRPREFCDCVHWVLGVISIYFACDCIETVSTTGISKDYLVHELDRRQVDALIRLQILALSDVRVHQELWQSGDQVQ
ncbi:uncharacterized protein AKAW2_50308S [Aspergillus luchuensis]|uniref:Uncharacterized protein n=1 Tax=Aspergillus kawachii TaxID=1069201 RepID=A0A7R8A045_ASPKA|nr:uncharacterized protein AKAW2_50308S [Aspergillus luchuensis]KAI3054282.1 hypothetical protein CBS147353_11460 [Aspergillus niger]BCR99966.1 hypothetical protein AKAW2_50308S [Aspergillus luchuensis]GAA92360.1 hypothetical protein AKAW_10474 [Aspergillus luchuensis IFO 4308]